MQIQNDNVPTISLTKANLELELSCIYTFISTKGAATNSCTFTLITVTEAARCFGATKKMRRRCILRGPIIDTHGYGGSGSRP